MLRCVAMRFGLLEIKCPKVKSFIECKYLKEVIGSYRLKHSHSYYYQIIGQMGITGMPWCDFYVYTESDYHLERISFDKDFWAVMKHKLDIFFTTIICHCSSSERLCTSAVGVI